MKIVRDSAVRQEPAQPQAVSPEENRFSIRPRQIALFFLWMLAFTLLARGTSGALLPEVQLSTPAPNTITQSLTATGTIQWAAGSLFYLPEGLLVEAVFVSEGEAVQEGDKIAALRREDVEQKLRSLQAELAQKQTEYARLTKPVAADSYSSGKRWKPAFCRSRSRSRPSHGSRFCSGSISSATATRRISSFRKRSSTVL